MTTFNYMTRRSHTRFWKGSKPCNFQSLVYRSHDILAVVAMDRMTTIGKALPHPKQPQRSVDERNSSKGVSKDSKKVDSEDDGSDEDDEDEEDEDEDDSNEDADDDDDADEDADENSSSSEEDSDEEATGSMGDEELFWNVSPSDLIIAIVSPRDCADTRDC